MKKFLGFVVMVAIAVGVITRLMSEKRASKASNVAGKAEGFARGFYEGMQRNPKVKDLRSNVTKVRGQVEKSIEKGRKRIAA